MLLIVVEPMKDLAVNSKRTAPDPIGRDYDVSFRFLSQVLSLLAEVFLEPEADIKVRLLELLARWEEDGLTPPGIQAPLRAMVAHCPGPRDQAVEFVRLFLHGTAAATVHPYESVQMRGSLMAPECVDDLRDLYGAAGVQPRQSMHLPPDHLGMELDFLAYLLNRVASSRRREREQFRSLAVHLLRDHLLPFATTFGAKLSSADPHPYFAGAGEALGGTLAACAALVGIDA